MTTLDTFLAKMGRDPMEVARTLERAKIKGRPFDEGRNCPVRKYLLKKAKADISRIDITEDDVILYNGDEEVTRARLPYPIFWFLQMFDADFFSKKLYMKNGLRKK